MAFIAVTTTLNPAPLVIWTFELSTVKTSPNWYPDPVVKFDIEFIVPVVASIVIEHCAPEPLPVNETRGILLVPPGAAYPAPLETISKEVAELIAAPLPSTIPVTHKSSFVFAESDPLSVLTFLPIGKSPDAAPEHFTVNFLGNTRIGLSGNICVLRFPASIGVL